MKSREKKLMKTALLLATVCVLVGSVCLTAGCIDNYLFPSSSSAGSYSVSQPVASLPNPTLYVSSSPSGATVYANGNYKGTTPLTITLSPNTSSYITLEKSGYHPWYGYSQSLPKGGSDSLIVSLDDIVVGNWKSDLGTSYLYLYSGGNGSKSVLGVSSSVGWYKVTDNVYEIGGSRYTLSSSKNTLSGPIATYRRQ